MMHVSTFFAQLVVNYISEEKVGGLCEKRKIFMHNETMSQLLMGNSNKFQKGLLGFISKVRGC